MTIKHDGITGYGEATPSRYYGDEAKFVKANLDHAANQMTDAEPRDILDTLDRAHHLLNGNRAALCVLDLALHDWNLKRAGVSLHDKLGLDVSQTPLSSFTIGISDIEHMREKTREAKDYPILKVKLGTDHDLEILQAMREETDAVFRVDANCAWTPEETIERSHKLKELGVEFIEQPVAPDRLDDMEKVFRESALPLIADESGVTPEDVPGLVNRFHGINIKYMKCGGIAPALQMIQAAREVGLKIMIGCMIETSVGISAGAQLGPLVDYLDLDGALLISNDPFTGVENQLGKLVFPDRPGLGAIRHGE
jgi:L-alanine-DL-glutamate epimerase-like enolase superfamily enzyme